MKLLDPFVVKQLKLLTSHHSRPTLLLSPFFSISLSLALACSLFHPLLALWPLSFFLEARSLSPSPYSAKS